MRNNRGILRYVCFAVAIAGTVAALSGCSPKTEAPPADQTVDGMVVSVTRTDPTPLHTGDNTVVVTITDAATGAPIADANLTATADMTAPQLPGPETSGRSLGNGQYGLPVRLSVATTYDLHVAVLRQGKPETDVVLPLDVAQ